MSAKLIDGRKRKQTVLFVDDEALVRRVGARMLARLGYTVLLAENGEEACKIYGSEHNNIDLIVLDLSMPVMDGKDTFVKLHEINSDVKVVISSGFDGDGKAGSLLEMGALGFVQKPFDMKSLSSKLKAC